MHHHIRMETSQYRRVKVYNSLGTITLFHAAHNMLSRNLSMTLQPAQKPCQAERPALGLDRRSSQHSQPMLTSNKTNKQRRRISSTKPNEHGSSMTSNILHRLRPWSLGLSRQLECNCCKYLSHFTCTHTHTHMLLYTDWILPTPL